MEPEMPGISKAAIRDAFGKKLTESQAVRAMKLLEACGGQVTGDVINVVFHAADQGPAKVGEILDQIQRHFEEVLQFEHPEIRGRSAETYRFFESLCRVNLGLTRS
jgi:hypothetical protein